MALTLVQIGLIFAVATFVTGEFLAPLSEEAAQKLRLKQTSSVVAQAFRSGLWVKDDESFVNVARVLYDATLQDVRIYEFDDQYRLRTISQAREGKFVRENLWSLKNVVQTRFEDDHTSVASYAAAGLALGARRPSILSVLLVPPEKMSVWTLYSYVQHLRENRQESARYEIALWNKMVYPIAVLVMMVLALPFAYMNVREGGVSTKIFAGIMLGLGFHLLNRLFGHLGQLAAWPPMLAALRADRRVPRARDPHDPALGAQVSVLRCGWCVRSPRLDACSNSRVPLRRSCRNWRSRSSSAHQNPIPNSKTPHSASRKRAAPDASASECRPPAPDECARSSSPASARRAPAIDEIDGETRRPARAGTTGA